MNLNSNLTNITILLLCYKKVNCVRKKTLSSISFAFEPTINILQIFLLEARNARLTLFEKVTRLVIMSHLCCI